MEPVEDMPMNIRENMEQRELELLSPYAAHSGHSRGRERIEEECDVRTVYQRDRDRILHCKAFRRMKDKTQVFLAPQGDHYRNRLTHTLEVSQIARTIAKALRLNEDLVEAIALGHDLGHTPFGHAGERALDEIHPGGFTHYQQSIRVVQILEKSGEGLNLTWEVRDGILNHRISGSPTTLEGQVVRFSDRKFFTYKADMLFFPVAASETVEQDCKYFLINKRSAVVWSTLTVGECQRFISGIKWIERKAVFGMMRSVIKEFMKKPLPGIHMDRNLCNLTGCGIFQYNVHVPVETFELQILKVQ